MEELREPEKFARLIIRGDGDSVLRVEDCTVGAESEGQSGFEYEE